MVEAFGKPGIEPRWSHGDKDGIGTAYSASSQIWYTLWGGVITEVYYPTVDKPQLRDLQFLVSDGRTLFHEEKVNLLHQTEKMHHSGLAYRIVNSDPEGRYSISKDIICDPHSSVILQHTRLDGEENFLKELRLYALCAPHINVGGFGNTARVVVFNGRRVLVAEKEGTYMALGASVPFRKASCGYVGSSDGWTDISANHEMTLEFSSARDGNVALTGELDVSETREFVLGLSMGDSLHSAVTRLFQALSMDFESSRERFFEQWERSMDSILPLESASRDGGKLYRSSYGVLMAHEDKSFEGALIASLSIPWGEVAGDNNQGGYHLVWTRDMCNSATAALAAGNTDLPLRALIYLSVAQMDDGRFPQNFWIDGTPYWHGIQLDEAAFPIMLAWRTRESGLLNGFDPYTMVMKAARFIVANGPSTQQERWEEASGYSPSTLASSITALICAADIARGEGDVISASYLEDYADFLEGHIEAWTVTQNGSLVPGIREHYIRINPARQSDGIPDESPDKGVLHINNISPEQQSDFPARDVVDGGFLELVRYGIRKPDDPIIVDSVRVIDSVLGVETALGQVWHRYNHDGYGQRDDGSAYQGWGTGRAWPLLTGERAHYELALGNSVTDLIEAMEKFAGDTLLLPEQVWDRDDLPARHLAKGRATGSARPLVWAHAEYVKLLRSARDGVVFDRVGIVRDRYLEGREKCRNIEIWKHNRRVAAVKADSILRIQASSPFTLHWSSDAWSTVNDTESTPTPLNIHYVDIDIAGLKQKDIKFTFHWIDGNRWEGTDYGIRVE